LRRVIWAGRKGEAYRMLVPEAFLPLENTSLFLDSVFWLFKDWILDLFPSLKWKYLYFLNMVCIYYKKHTQKNHAEKMKIPCQIVLLSIKKVTLFCSIYILSDFWMCL